MRPVKNREMVEVGTG